MIDKFKSIDNIDCNSNKTKNCSLNTTKDVINFFEIKY